MNASLRCHLRKRRPSVVFGQAISGRHLVFELARNPACAPEAVALSAAGSLAVSRYRPRPETFS